ncbi:hypothetical protein [Nocardioides sp. zg-DK7169]|uniref:hypothetical protein n=1 Tax=Nocardioides sp. zg-DK7169 TaxID=2736600 RepID=UPI0015531E10|nr:hypothetical protein [Nocardioides sp. zg-DK7169]NPC96967.1 hypothetical protein [Nocardioides sp. zg-DK7169]
MTGLLALAGVGVVVGVVIGLVALVGIRMLGIGGDDEGGRAGAQQSMYIPDPVRTTGDSGPQITLATEDPEESEESDSPSPSESETTKDEGITLQSAQSSVSGMEQIDLSGVYPDGEGAILQVERFVDGGWTDFPVTASVSGGTFSTYVQTGQAGENRFRVRDTSNGELSNVVKVRVG